MSIRYDINRFDQVVPIFDGRVSNDTREYREATELELQQREEIATLEKEIEGLKEELEEVKEKAWNKESEMWGMISDSQKDSIIRSGL